MKGFLYHIMPHSSRGWGIKRSGSTRTSCFKRTFRGIEKVGNDLLKSGRASHVLVHGSDLKVLRLI